MHSFTCIVCPNGCALEADEKDGVVSVTGAKCPKGVKFAENELTNPTRTVTTSVMTSVAGFPVVSVKTDGEIPKNKIFPLMKLLKNYVLDKRVPINTVIVPDVFKTGTNVVTTTSMEE